MIPITELKTTLKAAGNSSTALSVYVCPVTWQKLLISLDGFKLGQTLQTGNYCGFTVLSDPDVKENYFALFTPDGYVMFKNYMAGLPAFLEWRNTLSQAPKYMPPQDFSEHMIFRTNTV